jgi:hypothetical protein
MLGSRFSDPFRIAFLTALLMARPCSLSAQRGGAGRSIGGGSEVVGGLNSVGKPSGVSAKDDLKDFHDALAVQASSEQIVEFAAWQKSASAARAALQILANDPHEDKKSASQTDAAAAFLQALETVDNETRKFLNGLSERQKVGLKEMVKRVTKADVDLVQSERDIPSTAGTRATPLLLQNLDHLLANIQSEQLGLGEEMGIGDRTGRGNAFNLPAVKTSVLLANQTVTITTSGVVSQSTASAGASPPAQTFEAELTADFSELQENMTAVLRGQLDRAERCGERISIERATLAPFAPESVAVAQLHYERWGCFGRDANEIAEGYGTIEIELTPAVGEDGELRLLTKVRRVDARGLVGELLRSGALGDGVRDKISETVLSAARQGGDFNAMLPSAAKGHAKLQRAQFQAVGSGRLMVVFDAEIQVSNDAAVALAAELKARETKTGAPAQEAVKQTVSR